MPRTRGATRRARSPVKEEIEEEEESLVVPKKKPREDVASGSCPYLATVNRAVLDFDFDKVCSVTLDKINVYGCLVCGTYVAGRGQGSPAMLHALQQAHHVFIHLGTGRFYCLPDDYEIIDPSLADIAYNLAPTYTPSLVRQIDENKHEYRTLEGEAYRPGVVGMNNINHNDWLNATLQALFRIPTLRDYFLLPQQSQVPSLPSCEAALQMAAKRKGGDHTARRRAARLVEEFGALVRKVWNTRSYRAHVSPHELVQCIATVSEKRFRLGHQSDPSEFLPWMLHQLHYGLTAEPATRPCKKHLSIVTYVFRGGARITADSQPAKDVDTLCLSLPLPSYQEAQFAGSSQPQLPGNDTIPQVSLYSLLQRFDGKHEQLDAQGLCRRTILTQLPRYLVLHYRRFVRNAFFVEKERTLVSFPLRDLDLSSFVDPSSNSDGVLSHAQLEALPTDQLRRLAVAALLQCSAETPREELVRLLDKSLETQRALKTRYKLVSSVSHQGLPQQGKGSYRVHVWHAPERKWFEVQDLHVEQTIEQLVTVSEAYVQVWERQDIQQVIPK